MSGPARLSWVILLLVWLWSSGGSAQPESPRWLTHMAAEWRWLEGWAQLERWERWSSFSLHIASGLLWPHAVSPAEQPDFVSWWRRAPQWAMQKLSDFLKAWAQNWLPITHFCRILLGKARSRGSPDALWETTTQGCGYQEEWFLGATSETSYHTF